MKFIDLKHALLSSFMIASVTGVYALAAEPPAGEKDALRTTLLESREKNRGVILHCSGASISMVVTALDAVYVVGRSQASPRIVVRLDRIDAVSAAF
jgi:hypothetical protein